MPFYFISTGCGGIVIILLVNLFLAVKDWCPCFPWTFFSVKYLSRPFSFYLNLRITLQLASWFAAQILAVLNRLILMIIMTHLNLYKIYCHFCNIYLRHAKCAVKEHSINMWTVGEGGGNRKELNSTWEWYHTFIPCVIEASHDDARSQM